MTKRKEKAMEFSQIFEVLLQIILLAVGGLLVPYLKSKIGSAKYQDILTAVEMGVGAAEQIYKSYEKGQEKDKLRYRFVADLLSSKGIKLNENEIRAMIEDAVLRLNKAIDNKEPT